MSKKKEGSGKLHVTKSWEQMMASAQLNALKPFIEQQVQMTGQIILQRLSSLVMENLANIQSRQLAFEKLLNVDSDKLALAVADVEDDASGCVAVDLPIQADDRVRIEYWAKKADTDSYEDRAERILIHELLKTNNEGRVQTLGSLESALVGMKSGDVQELKLALNEEPEDLKYLDIKVKVVRVSRKRVGVVE